MLGESIKPLTEDLATDQLRDPRAHIQDALIEVMQRLSDRMAGKRNPDRLSTGFDELDETLDGFGKTQLVLLAGPSWMGKTTYALQISDYVACESGKAVLYVGLQEAVDDLTERLLTSRARIEPRTMQIGRGFTKSEMTSLSKAYEELKQASIHFYCSPSPTICQIEEEARRLKQSTGLDLIVIDDFQLLVMAEDRERARGRSARMSQRIKQLAFEMDVPVLVLSQIDHNIEDREDQRPQMADVFERNEVERFADVVLLLYRSEYFDPDDRPGIAEIIVAKNRSGMTGVATLGVRRCPFRFTNISTISTDF